MSTHEIYEELSGAWRRIALNTQQLKLGLGSSDAPGSTLVDNRGQVVKSCYCQQEHRRCSRHGDECRTSDSSTDSGHNTPVVRKNRAAGKSIKTEISVDMFCLVQANQYQNIF